MSSPSNYSSGEDLLLLESSGVSNGSSEVVTSVSDRDISLNDTPALNMTLSVKDFQCPIMNFSQSDSPVIAPWGSRSSRSSTLTVHIDKTRSQLVGLNISLAVTQEPGCEYRQLLESLWSQLSEWIIDNVRPSLWW